MGKTEWEEQFEGKRVLIMGLGLNGGGVGTARFFVRAKAHVTVTDLKLADSLKSSIEALGEYKIVYVLGGHREEDFINTDLIIRNPDVSKNSPFLEIAKNHDVPVEMEDALFAKLCPLPIIGVTGTRGKTTTTMMVASLLRAAGKKVLVGGNVRGVSSLELLREIGKKGRIGEYKGENRGMVIMELSSWQLQGFDEDKISPHIAIITNIYPDHLNRYKDMDEYVNDKKSIYRWQKDNDWLLLNKDQYQENVKCQMTCLIGGSPKEATNDKSISNDKYQNKNYEEEFADEARSKIVWFSKNDLPESLKTGIQVPGEHNLENAAAAWQVGKILGIGDKIMERALAAFPGVEHRLEKVRVLDGVIYINDTTSTTPTATVMALRALYSSGKRNIILIVGGNNKKLPLGEMAKEIAEKTKTVIFLAGNGTPELKIALGAREKVLSEKDFTDFQKAVLAAKNLAIAGDIILLSPGFTSFAMFANEFERGERFKEIVGKL